MQIGDHKYLAQVWVIPGFEQKFQEFIPGPKVRVRCLSVKMPTGETADLIVFEAGMDEPLIQNVRHVMRNIGQVMTRLSFSTLTQFFIVQARVIPIDNTCRKVIMYPDRVWPGGIGMSELRIGYNKQGAVRTEFLDKDVKPDVERAIHWYIKGWNSTEPFDKYIYYWTGLESLAEEVSEPWKCEKCGTTLENCPNPQCNHPTITLKATKPMRLLLNQLGVSKERIKDYIDTRNDILHGRLVHNGESRKVLGDKDIQIENLLLQKIKQELDWPAKEPPTVELKGITVDDTPIEIGWKSFPNYDLDTPFGKIEKQDDIAANGTDHAVVD